MSIPFEDYTTYAEGLTQAAGVKELLLKRWRSARTQVSFNTDSATAGSVTFQVKYHPSASWENLLDDSGSQRSVSLTAALSFILENDLIHALRVTPVGVVGNYSVYCYQEVSQ